MIDNTVLLKYFRASDFIANGNDLKNDLNGFESVKHARDSWKAAENALRTHPGTTPETLETVDQKRLIYESLSKMYDQALNNQKIILCQIGELMRLNNKFQHSQTLLIPDPPPKSVTFTFTINKDDISKVNVTILGF